MCTSRRPGKKTIRQVIYNQGTPAPGTYNQTTQKSEKKQEIRIFRGRNQKKENKKSESLGLEIRKNEKSVYLKSELRLFEYSSAK